MDNIAVALEIGPKRRVFAQALEWIGWCRAGKDEATALNHLVTAGLRYARVAERAGLTFVPPPSIEAFEIVERMPGTAPCGAAGGAPQGSSHSSPQVWLFLDSALCSAPIGMARARSCLGTPGTAGQVNSVSPCGILLKRR